MSIHPVRTAGLLLALAALALAQLPAPADPPLAAQLEVARDMIAMADPLVRTRGLEAAEGLVDAHPFDEVAPLLAQWQVHAARPVRRAGRLLLEGARTADELAGFFERAVRAGADALTGRPFVLVHTPSRTSALRAWLLRQTHSPDGTRQCLLLRLDGRPEEVVLPPASDGAGPPVIEPGDLPALARTLAADAAAGGAVANGRAGDPAGLVLMAVVAHAAGHRVLAGELMFGAAHVRGAQAFAPMAPGDDRMRAFARTAIARVLLRLVLHAHANGAPAHATRAALARLNDALEPRPLRPVLADLLAHLPGTVTDAPGLAPDSSPVERADWHIDRLTDLRLDLPDDGTVPESLGLFSPGTTDIHALWRLNVHAIPLLIARVGDRRPTRTLLDVGSEPWPVRVGDVCYGLLRRLSGRLLVATGQAPTPVPTLNHNERDARQAATDWWHELGNPDERAFLSRRATDRTNPDRLAMLDRLQQIAPDHAIELMRHLLEAGAGEIETALTARLIELDYEEQAAWLKAYAARARLSATRWLLAEQLWARSGDPGGVEPLLHDLEAGHFTAGAGTLGEQIALAREVAAEWPDTLSDVDERLGTLLTAGVLSPLQRLDLLLELARPQPDVPAVWREAMVRLALDTGVTGAGLPPDRIPDEVEGMLAPRWRDYGTAALARSLDATDLLDWQAGRQMRDVATARVLGRLAETQPAACSRELALRVARRVALPPVLPMARDDALPLVMAVARADSAEALETARAACREAGLALWEPLVFCIRRSRTDDRARLIHLARQVAGTVRDVRITVCGAGDAATHDTVAAAIRQDLPCAVGHLSSADLPFDAVRHLLTAARREAGYGPASTEVLLERLPDGGGLIVSLHVRLVPFADSVGRAQVRAAVVAGRAAPATTSLQTSMDAETAMIRLLLGDFERALAAALDAPVDEPVDARLTISRSMVQ